jgi:hypothetical protein
MNSAGMNEYQTHERTRAHTFTHTHSYSPTHIFTRLVQAKRRTYLFKWNAKYLFKLIPWLIPWLSTNGFLQSEHRVAPPPPQPYSPPQRVLRRAVPPSVSQAYPSPLICRGAAAPTTSGARAGSHWHGRSRRCRHCRCSTPGRPRLYSAVRKQQARLAADQMLASRIQSQQLASSRGSRP